MHFQSPYSLFPELVIVSSRNQQLVEWLPTTLGKLGAALGCYFILGNHDWYLDPAPIRHRLVELGWRDVAGTTATIDHRGCKLVIGGTERPWMGEHPNFNAAESSVTAIIDGSRALSLSVI